MSKFLESHEFQYFTMYIHLCMYTGIIFMVLFQVLSVGPTGTGKSLAIADKLINGMPSQYMPEFIVFSAKTSANQTQDLIDGKLDKRRKGKRTQ